MGMTLVELYLFDSMLNSIISKVSKVVALLVAFPSNEYMNLDFYIILLDLSCSLVLGYS